MDNRIESEHLVMKVLKPTEAALVAAFYSRNFEDFAQYEPLIRKQSLSIYYQRQVLECENKYRTEGSRIRYYLFQKYDPFRAIGTVSFREINKDNKGTCIVGYKVDQGFRRRGFAREALSTLIPMVRYDYHVGKIEAEVLPWNRPSQNLLVGLGFHRTALLKSRVCIDGKYDDEYLYVLDKCDAVK